MNITDKSRSNKGEPDVKIRASECNKLSILRKKIKASDTRAVRYIIWEYSNNRTRGPRMERKKRWSGQEIGDGLHSELGEENVTNDGFDRF